MTLLLCEQLFTYLGGGQFFSDRAADGNISTAALVVSVKGPQESARRSSAGYRMSVDRDDDGVLDQDAPHL